MRENWIGGALGNVEVGGNVHRIFFSKPGRKMPLGRYF
jgi:hypothetical protein